jgi:PQQ-like domain
MAFSVRTDTHRSTTSVSSPRMRTARSLAASKAGVVRSVGVSVTAIALMLVGLDPCGMTAVAGASRKWTSTYDGPASQADTATAIAIAPSGGTVFVTGSSDGSTRERSSLATIAYGAKNGDTRWVRRRLTTGEGFAGDIVADAGRLFVAGGGRRGMLTIAYAAASGERLWSSTASSRRYGGARAVVANGSLGGVFVTGGPPMRTVAYARGTGRRLWTMKRPGLGADVALSPSRQRVYAIGATQRKAVAIAYRASDGHELWQSAVDRFSLFGSSGIADTLAIAPDGRMILMGGSAGRGHKFGIVALRAATGELAWTRHFAVPPDGSVVTDVSVAPTGRRVFATGTLGIDPALGFVTAAYRLETGERNWVDRVPVSVGYPAALAVAPRGRHLFVTGRVAGKLETISYRAGSGRRRWIRRLRANSGGTDAVAGPGGSTFLTGWRGNGRSRDFLTVAYSR